MDIPLKAKVECTDGSCGQSTTVIVDPVKRELTHLVVRGPHMREVLVPVSQIENTSQGQIRLKCTKQELSEMPSFVETHYVESDEPIPEYPGYQTVLMDPWATPMEVSYVEEVVERIPPGELAVRRGTRVEATDGHVGQVGEFVVEPESGHITHLILLEGHLWAKKEVTLPLSAIDHSEGDTVYLNLDKKAVEALPSVPVRRHYGGGK